MITRLNAMPLLSVVALIAALAQEPIPDRIRTTEQLIRMLEKFGYGFTRTEGPSNAGTIARGKLSIPFTWELGVAGEKDGGYICALDFEIEFNLPRDADLSAPDQLKWKSKARISPHLGKTSTVSLQIDFYRELNRQKVRDELSDLWNDVEKYQSLYHAKMLAESAFYIPDQKHYSFPAQFVINRADEISFRRLLVSWGWDVKPYFGGGPYWYFPFEISGQEVGLSSRSMNVAFTDPFPTNLVVESRVSFPDAHTFDRLLKASPTWAKFERRDQNVLLITQNIDLSKGVRLEELKKRIEDFARKVSAVAPRKS